MSCFLSIFFSFSQLHLIPADMSVCLYRAGNKSHCIAGKLFQLHCSLDAYMVAASKVIVANSYLVCTSTGYMGHRCDVKHVFSF